MNQAAYSILRTHNSVLRTRSSTPHSVLSTPYSCPLAAISSPASPPARPWPPLSDPAALRALTLPRADRPRPTRAQLEWQRDELALFLHFGVNTFTDREWGDGNESPAIFNPARLDARQWARAAKAAGAKAMILTAKHHDGFCLWPTATTRHSVASSPWKGGQGRRGA